MIEQVVACAKGNAEPPPELEIIWGCQRYNCLPEAGGYLDQDVTLMKRGTTYENIYSFVKRNRQSGKAINYAELSEADREIFDWLRGMEIRF
jgi:ABC-type protease/lipase transport system fused ATPase/permease subunit